jgi:uncharacterized membrane protein YqjE
MSEPNSTSLFSSLKRLGDVAVATVHNRIELLAVELQEEKCRFIQALLLTAATIALGVTSLVLITITIVILFWENARMPVLCVLSGLSLLGAILLGRWLKKVLESGPGFASTLDELKKDRACFQAND